MPPNESLRFGSFSPILRIEMKRTRRQKMDDAIFRNRLRRAFENRRVATVQGLGDMLLDAVRPYAVHVSEYPPTIYVSIVPRLGKSEGYRQHVRDLLHMWAPVTVACRVRVLSPNRKLLRLVRWVLGIYDRIRSARHRGRFFGWVVWDSERV